MEDIDRLKQHTANLGIRSKDMSLATKLKELRIKQGKSLQQIADVVGISKTHVYDLEKGKSTNPSIELLKSYANQFQVSIKMLVGEDMNADTEDQELVRMFRQAGELETSDKKLLDDIIQSMRARGSTK